MCDHGVRSESELLTVYLCVSSWFFCNWFCLDGNTSLSAYFHFILTSKTNIFFINLLFFSVFLCVYFVWLDSVIYDTFFYRSCCLIWHFCICECVWVCLCHFSGLWILANAGVLSELFSILLDFYFGIQLSSTFSIFTFYPVFQWRIKIVFFNPNSFSKV